MTSEELCALGAGGLRESYLRRELSPLEVVDAILTRTYELNPDLRAYITVTDELARSGARAAEAAYARQDASCSSRELLGVPVSIKDNMPTAGIRTTMGSVLYEHWVPDFDAVVVERLRRAGAVILGKTNTSEFGWKGDTGNRLMGPTRNPWRRERTAGGSSGGAAAAVATGLGPVAVGTDGAGSLRIPASFCGVLGYKPAQGTVPVHPPSGIGTLSHHGPIARTVADVALVTRVLAGDDARDPLSLGGQTDRLRLGDDTGVAGMRVAWSPTLGYARSEPHVLSRAEAAARVFERLGCHVEEVDPGWDDPHETAWTIIAAANAAQHADDLDAVKDVIDPGRLALVIDGRMLSAVDLARAQVARGRFYEEARLFMNDWDLLLTPTLPLTAFEVGLDAPAAVAGVPTEKLRWTPFTYPFNLTGHPAISVPCGLDDSCLPVGLQIVGPWRRDDLALRAAAAFECAQPWSRPT